MRGQGGSRMKWAGAQVVSNRRLSGQRFAANAPKRRCIGRTEVRCTTSWSVWVRSWSEWITVDGMNTSHTTEAHNLKCGMVSTQVSMSFYDSATASALLAAYTKGRMLLATVPWRYLVSHRLLALSYGR